MYDAAIGHFQASFISLFNFRSLSNRQEYIYVETLLGVNLLADKPNPDGDELPDSCLEVAYLLDIFQHGGAAPGFRAGDNVMEWLCFGKKISESSI
jgi:hypothetical protein